MERKAEHRITGNRVFPCPSESFLYKRKAGVHLGIIVVYVDDLVIKSCDNDDLNEIKTLISKEFDVVDGGQLKRFLGMEIEREGATGIAKLVASNILRHF